MKADQLEDLRKKIEQLKSIMIAVATGEARIQDNDEAYVELYQKVDLDIELLQEENVSILNPNSFASLWDWYNYWSSNLDNYVSRRKYVYDLYAEITSRICNLEGQFIQSNASILSGILETESLEDLLAEIQRLQSIMIDVATGSALIQDEETNYIQLYQEISSYICGLQQVGLAIKNPNDFGSLWHWHSYWKSELSDYASRRQFVRELYINIVTPIQKSLRKHQHSSTSTEEFIEDLQDRFKTQVLKQLSTLKIEGTEVIEQNTGIKANNISARTQTSNLNSPQLVISQVPDDTLTEPLIDFAIITAIKIEREAIFQAFNITSDDRVHKGSRTYWRKRLPLRDGKFYEIVVAQSLDMANVNSALLANDTLHYWKPATVLMVGIAATARSAPTQQLGDLVIGKEVYYYEMGKVTATGTLPEPKQIPVDATLLDRVQALPDHDFPIHIDRPDGINTRPKIELGVIASGDKVIADVAERDMIATTNRKIMAIEMEGYGVIEAVRQSFDQVRCLVIRALCDYADSSKNDQWHAYAAAVCASFTKHFLLDKPLDPRNQL